MGATVMPDWRICRVTGEPLLALGGGAPVADVRAATRADVPSIVELIRELAVYEA